MTETEIWRRAFERLAARVTFLCDFDASESAAPEDERWALELDQLAQFTKTLTEQTETAVTAPVALADPETFDVVAFFYGGGTVTLAFDAGEEGRCNEDGDVISEPYDAFYYADATTADGEQVAAGASLTSPTEALAHLTPVRRWNPEDSQGQGETTPF